MSIRKEKEREFFVEHMPTFRTLKTNDPFFVIKTAFFQKGKVIFAGLNKLRCFI